MTDYSRRSFDNARSHCRKLGAWSLPTSYDPTIDRAFRIFLRDDPAKHVSDSTVWVGVYSQPIEEKHKWIWLSGVSTGKLLFVRDIIG